MRRWSARTFAAQNITTSTVSGKNLLPLQASCERITLCDNILAAGTRTIIARLTFEGFENDLVSASGRLEKIPSRFAGGPSNCNTGFLVLLTEPFESPETAHQRFLVVSDKISSTARGPLSPFPVARDKMEARSWSRALQSQIPRAGSCH